MTETQATPLDEPAVRDAKSPVAEAELPDLKTVDPQAPLPRLRTALTPEAMKERLARANYRGRLPEIDWPLPGEVFKLDILGNRLEHDVFATISGETDAPHREISFTVRLKRRPVWFIIAVILVSTPIGAFFMYMVPLLNRIPYPWVWFPILNIGLGGWWLWAELLKTVPRAWLETKRYIREKIAPEIDAEVIE